MSLFSLYFSAHGMDKSFPKADLHEIDQYMSSYDGHRVPTTTKALYLLYIGRYLYHTNPDRVDLDLVLFLNLYILKLYDLCQENILK